MYHIPDFQKVQGHVHELQNSEIFRNNSSWSKESMIFSKWNVQAPDQSVWWRSDLGLRQKCQIALLYRVIGKRNNTQT